MRSLSSCTSVPALCGSPSSIQTLRASLSDSGTCRRSTLQAGVLYHQQAEQAAVQTAAQLSRRGADSPDRVDPKIQRVGPLITRPIAPRRVPEMREPVHRVGDKCTIAPALVRHRQSRHSQRDQRLTIHQLRCSVGVSRFTLWQLSTSRSMTALMHHSGWAAQPA